MKLRFTHQAKQDLDNIADFIRERDPEAALRVRAAIMRALRTLAFFPHIGRLQTVSSVRKLVTRRYKYLIYYVVEEAVEEIVVLTIKHPARDREHSDA